MSQKRKNKEQSLIALNLYCNHEVTEHLVEISETKRLHAARQLLRRPQQPPGRVVGQRRALVPDRARRRRLAVAQAGLALDHRLDAVDAVGGGPHEDDVHVRLPAAELLGEPVPREPRHGHGGAPRHDGRDLGGVLAPAAEPRDGAARQPRAAVGNDRRGAALDARGAPLPRLRDADGEVEGRVHGGERRVEPREALDGDGELRVLAVVEGPLVGEVERGHNDHEREQRAEDRREDPPEEPHHVVPAAAAAAGAGAGAAVLDVAEWLGYSRVRSHGETSRCDRVGTWKALEHL